MFPAEEVGSTVHWHPDDRQAGRRERFGFALGLRRPPKLEDTDNDGDESEKSFHDILLR